MFDQYNALVVVLDKPKHEYEVKALIEAIQQLRGVLHVEPKVHDSLQAISDGWRIKKAFTDALWDAIDKVKV